MDMNGFIGKRFNLISKSDIRYVGTLHQINPEDSTIALENVTSHGTEGRRGDPSEEIPPSTNVYEYIVFRGSDVKDISVATEEEKPAPPPVPYDPAILGSTRPAPPVSGSAAHTPQPIGPAFPAGPGAARPPPMPQAGWAPPQAPFPGYFPPYNQRFGPPGFPPAAPSMPGPYGAPGWFPPASGDAFPNVPPQFPPSMPIGTPQAAFQRPFPPQPQPGAQTPVSMPPAKPVEPQVEKSEAQAKQSPAQAAASPTKANPAAPQQGQAVDAGVSSTMEDNAKATANAMQEASRAATAAVAAAMAKLPPQNGAKGPTDVTIESKVTEVKPQDGAPRGGHRGGAPRGGPRGGSNAGYHGPPRKLDVPATDFDFETSNAKFNKEDLAKEAGTPRQASQADAASPAHDGAQAPESVASGTSAAGPAFVPYNKSSFFDNISSESRDREEGVNARREWRGEEQRRNLETFGQGSVDSGFRSYRGRGRGRGYGRGRGFMRGGGRGGRGGFRGPRQDAPAGAPMGPAA